jgi:hypothetical protein
MSGTFNYGCDGFQFTASGLAVDTEYVLISYKEPYPGTGLNVLGSEKSTGTGTISITGTAGWADNLVINTYGPAAEGDYKDQTGAKVWLVPASDISGGQFTVWNPSTYLFDRNLISPVCSGTGGAATTVSGSISKSLSISTDENAIAFGSFKVGQNRADSGSIIVTSSFVPTWKVTAATSDNEGYMRIGSPFVTGTKLTEKLQQYNYKASAWQNANDLEYTGTGDYTMQKSFIQNVLVGDIAGVYGTVVTYTVAEV